MNVTVQESIHISAPTENVWDYTQDWTRRTEWDPAIRSAEIVSAEARTIRARTSGGTFTIRYKLFERPHRTSLSMTDSTSSIVTGGGGAWTYSAEDGGTRFTQHNTLVVPSRVLGFLLGGLLAWQLARSTRQALANAKRRIEASLAIAATTAPDGPAPRPLPPAAG